MFWHYFKRLRNKQVLKYITAQDTHLDVGCGDGWLYKHSPACYRVRFDRKRHGLAAEIILPNFSLRYTKITLVAVVEHLDDPAFVLRECCRLLADGGQILITSPTRLGELFVPFINNFKSSGHKRVVTFKSLREWIPPDYKITRKFFECFGNALYIVEKK